MSSTENESLLSDLAVIGMCGRFPGARNIEEFWQNLRDGVESISFFSDEELIEAGVDPAAVDTHHVRARGVLDDIEMFDAPFFGINPREAEIIDPQHRVFLECAWHALEDAGYDPEKYDGSVGVFAGPNFNSYFLFNLFSNLELLKSYGHFETTVRSRPDLLTTFVSYKLNLHGPSVAVQTACSTSLVATHMACQSLLNHECDMALAGGVSISVPQKAGYVYREGGILSPDGHCRAFDARAQGTVFGNGVGIVVLKRLADALADGDTIHAVIKGSAINNDGSAKVGYTAPSLEGQAAVIAEAQAAAGVDCATISYMEAHGTGTALGDPIEVAALTNAFRASTQQTGFCALGSVKTNIGHLDTAAGIAGFIKCVLSLKHQLLPASLHFQQPNPQIDFSGSPFFVNTELRRWTSLASSRRAAVSSFGIGGTNAHVILEEAPEVEPPASPKRHAQLLLLSAKTETALEAATDRLAAHLREHPDSSLADVAYTLQVGRKSFACRRMILAESVADAIESLENKTASRVRSAKCRESAPPVVFMFPGQGAQYVQMGRELYETEDVYRQEVDRCAETVKAELGVDLRDVLYPEKGREDEAARELDETRLTQPALFVTEYAMARLWQSWGVEAQAMIGHSLGEYVAACLAGVMTLEEALRLVIARGRLMQRVEGAMISLTLPETETRQWLKRMESKGVQLSVAAVNGEQQCVVSGSVKAIAELKADLENAGIVSQQLRTSHPFHSALMEEVLEEFEREVERVELKAPQKAYISNVSGGWMTAIEATDKAYWVKHLRETVRYSAGLAKVLTEEDAILLEVGPGDVLSKLALRHPAKSAHHVVVPSMVQPKKGESAEAKILEALGRVWLGGMPVNWKAYFGTERRRRISLPTYPFERQRYWVDASKSAGNGEAAERSLKKRSEIADWFYVPVWKQTLPPRLFRNGKEGKAKSRWLIFVDECGLGSQLVERLKREGEDVISVTAGGEFSSSSDSLYQVAPGCSDDYNTLVKELRLAGKTPDRIVHLWSVEAVEPSSSRADCERILERGFYSLLFLAQALDKASLNQPVRIHVVSNGAQDVAGELIAPAKATLSGPCKVIPKEYSQLSCCHVDVAWPSSESEREKIVADLMLEFSGTATERVIAWRGRHRWVQTFEPVRLDETVDSPPLVRDGGVYLITGGLGHIGLTFAEYLVRTAHSKLVLVGRTSDRSEKLLELEALGAEIMVVRADVTDEEQMREVVAQATERFGAIHGVIHAAGVAGGGLIQLKTPEAAASVLAPKVFGTLVLDSIFKETPLDFFICCSSALALIGPLGQVDYCAANAFLDAFARERSARQGAFVVSLNWDGWREGGMAKRAGPSSTVLPAQTVDRGEKIVHPLFDKRIVESADRHSYITDFRVNKHWVLNEHRILGNAVIPGTAFLEMARAAFKEYANNGSVELQNVTFLSPLIVKDDQQSEVHTIVEKNGEGLNFKIVSRLAPVNGGEPVWQEHAIGKLHLLAAESPKKHEITELARRRSEQHIDTLEETPRNGEGSYIAFGPRWKSLKWIETGTDGLLGFLELPEEFSADLEEFELHPALMDVATGLAARQSGGGFYLPLSYERVKIKGRLPGKCFAYIKSDQSNRDKKETLSFDVLLLDENGAERVEVEGFMLKKVGSAAAKAQANNAVDDGKVVLQPELKGAASETKPEPTRESPVSGITPAEGIEAFRRILSTTGLSQVVISPRPLQVLIDKGEAYTQDSIVEEIAQAESPSPHYPRPALQTTYVAPRTEVEQHVASIWQKLLGIERVGIHDNFFELGGHSLLTLQVVSRLREVFQVELPMRDVFEATTVAELAKVIEEIVMAKILEKIGDLTDEEAKLLL